LQIYPRLLAGESHSANWIPLLQGCRVESPSSRALLSAALDHQIEVFPEALQILFVLNIHADDLSTS
jgi:hypothetical protein